MTHTLSKIFMAITAFNLLVAPKSLMCMLPPKGYKHKVKFEMPFSLSPEMGGIHLLEETSQHPRGDFIDGIDISNEDETIEHSSESGSSSHSGEGAEQTDKPWITLEAATGFFANLGQGVSQMGAKAGSNLYGATDVTGLRSLGNNIERSTDRLADTLEKTSTLLAKQLDTTTERLLDVTKKIADSFDKTSITMATFAARAGRDLRQLTSILSRSRVGLQARTLKTIDSATKKLVIATKNIENTAKIGQQTASDITENTKDIIALSTSGYIVYKTCNFINSSIANSHNVFSEQNAAYLGCGALGVAGIMGLRHCYRAKKAA